MFAANADSQAGATCGIVAPCRTAIGASTRRTSSLPPGSVGAPGRDRETGCQGENTAPASAAARSGSARPWAATLNGVMHPGRSPTDHGGPGAFLRARRAALDPHALGLPDDGRLRRVPGLRREELAHIAHVSIDDIVRLEQGRVRRVSRPVLTSLAGALRLTADERDYLYPDQLLIACTAESGSPSQDKLATLLKRTRR